MVNANKYLKTHAYLIAFTLFYFSPSIVKNIKYQLIQKQMSIHINAFEPPKLAFQEALKNNLENENTKNIWKEIKAKPSINLNKTHFERKSWNPITELKAQKISAQEIKFSQKEYEEFQEKNNWVNDLTPQQKNRIQIAQENTELLNQDWSTPSWKEYASQVIEKNNKENQKIAKNDVVKVYKENRDGTETGKESIHTASVELGDTDVGDNQIKLKGKIKILGGLALGDRIIEVKHFEEGIAKSTAVVDIPTGNFEINIDNIKGLIVADIIEKNGEIIATGKVSISKSNQNDLLEIQIRDNNNFAGTFYNFNKNPEILLSEKVNSMRGEKSDYLIASMQIEDTTDNSGSFKINKISEKSVSLIRAKAKGFSETLYTQISGHDQNIPLFSDTLIQALKNLVKEDNTNNKTYEDGATIWGQVLFDGKPLQGVTVKLLNHDENPTYLSGWIPDNKMVTTSKNGYFIFTNIESGMQTVIAEKEGVYIGHANFETDQQATSVVTIESTIKTKNLPVRVFDLFSGENIQADVYLQSLTGRQEINGFTEINLPELNRLSYGYLESISEEYNRTQFTYFDNDEYMHVPLIKNQYVQYFAQQAKVSIVPETSIIVGIVPDDNFEVFLPHEENFDKSNRVYFDATGRITESGKMGGGFILFNVPSKTQSVLVLSEKSNLVNSKLIPVEPNSTSILKFHF